MYFIRYFHIIVYFFRILFISRVIYYFIYLILFIYVYCRVSASIEVWTGGSAFTQYVTTNKQADSYPLGIVGVEGWWYYMPDAYLAENPVSSSSISTLLTYI